MLPELRNDPLENRVHGSPGELTNHLLFRPIGQVDVLAPMARLLMNNYGADGITSRSTYEDVVASLTPLKFVPWDLMHDMWRDLLISKNPQGGWQMANENRKERLVTARNLLYWVLGIEDLTEDHLDALKQEWVAWLGEGETEEREVVFDELEDIRMKSSSLIRTKLRTDGWKTIRS